MIIPHLQSSHPSLSLLIVDDEEEVLAITRLYLTSSYSFLVDTASSGSKALEKLNDQHYDAIVSDFEMEGMSGIDLLKTIRSGGDDIPFIVFTGRGRQEVVIESFESGADGYVQKGLDIQSQFAELAQKITTAIGKKQAEKKLRESEQKYRHLFEASDAGIALHEIICNESGIPVDYRFLEVNPAYERITSLHGSDIIGKTVLEVLPNTEPYWITTFGEVAITGKTIHFENYSRELGKFYEVTAYNPQKGQFACLVYDITEKKEQENQIVETNAFLENLITNANVPIIVWNPDFQITRINHASELLIGRPAQEVIGQPVSILLNFDQPEHSMRLIQTTHEGVRWETVEIPVVHQNGSVRSVLWNSATIFNSDGSTPVATIAQGRDVTIERFLEQEKEWAAIQIQENIAQLAILNDGIRNPLTIITAYADMAGNDRISDCIQNEVLRIDEMVTNLDRQWVNSEKILEYLTKHDEIRPEFLPIYSTSRVNSGSLAHTDEQFFSIAEIEQPHGSKKLLWERATLLPDSEGNRVCTKDSIRNQHEQEEAVGALRVERTRLKNIIEGTNAGTWEWNLQTNETIFNEKWAEMIGYTLDELSPVSIVTWEMLTHPDDLRHARKLLTQHFAGELPYYACELRMKHKNGQWIWMQDRGRIVTWTADGKPLLMFGLHIDITEQKLSENALILSETEKRILIETIPDLIWLKDPDGIYLSCNPAFEQFFGAKQKDIIGKTDYDFLDKDLADFFRNHDRRAMEANKPTINEEWLTIADTGYHGLYETIKTPMRDSHGNLIGVLGISRDITSRMQAEEALRESEEKYRTIVETAQEGIWILDAEYRTVSVNAYMAELLGYTPDEMKGRPIIDFLYPEELQNHDLIAAERKKGIAGIFERLYLTKGGEKVWGIVSSTPIIRDNAFAGAFAMVTDITERKQIESALRESEVKFRDFFNNTADAIAIHDMQDRFLEVNDEFCRRLGYSREELLNLGPHDIDEPEYAELVPLHILDLQESSHIVFETVHCAKDGTRIPTEISSRIFTYNQEPAILSICRDITERKKALEALWQSNQKLRLLTGLIRHDILNLLNAIHLYHSLAFNTPDHEVLFKYISLAREAGERIEAIIGFTREYEKFGITGSGWQRVHPIIESAKEEISPGTIIIENNVPLALEIYADPIIRKVFTTLLENAIRHGKTLSHIRFSVSEGEGDLAIVYEDDGIGIVAEEKEQIFEHGYGQNTGIGLFLSKEILSITGLSIRECGEETKGARFEILVPKGGFRIMTETNPDGRGAS
jgi:PAS domain S-box-containing protein